MRLPVQVAGVRRGIPIWPWRGFGDRTVLVPAAQGGNDTECDPNSQPCYDPTPHYVHCPQAGTCQCCATEAHHQHEGGACRCGSGPSAAQAP